MTRHAQRMKMINAEMDALIKWQNHAVAMRTAALTAMQSQIKISGDALTLHLRRAAARSMAKQGRALLKKERSVERFYDRARKHIFAVFKAMNTENPKRNVVIRAKAGVKWISDRLMVFEPQSRGELPEWLDSAAKAFNQMQTADLAQLKLANDAYLERWKPEGFVKG